MKPPEQKVWGTTIELFANGAASTHYIEVKAGGFCSEHRHEHKENVFYVIEGELRVTWWDIDGHEHGLTLFAGDDTAISVGIWHSFEAMVDTKCIEIYDYRYYGVDIERRVSGGLRTDKSD